MVLYSWPLKKIQCKKSHLNYAVLLHFCFTFLPSRTVPQQDDPEIFLPATEALQPSFEAPPMAPANMVYPWYPFVMLIIGWNIFKGCTFSKVFLDATDYIKLSHLSYDCTMSHSCLLGFPCQDLFQGAILCSLKQCLFGISIQRVRVTNRLSNCFMDLSVNSLSVFLAERPILPRPSYLGHLPSAVQGFYPSCPA